MKAWQVQGAFGLDNLARVDVDELTPPPGHVLVRVRAVSLNYRDLMMVRGQYNPKQPLPLVPCSDGAGEVVAAGAGCSDPAVSAVGARVATMFAQGWLGGPPSRARIKHTLGGPLPGTLATHVVLPESGLAPIPEGWSFEEASTLPCAALTAWSGLVEHARVQPGQRVLALGSGGVSTFALQLAKRAGARTAVVTAKPERFADGAALGGLADDVIDRRAHGDWEKQVRARWPDGADVVVEVGGAGTLSRSIKSTAVGGTVLVIGVLAGAADNVSVVPVLMQNIRLQGVFVGNRDGFVACARALSEGGVRPIIDRVFAFDDARAAFEHLAAGAHAGKIVIAVSP